MSRPHHGSTRSDRGATLITFALSLLAICTVIALVIGGSIGYTAERNSQTASDAAALAATSRLRDFQTREISSVDLFGIADEVAQANGSEPLASSECQVIRANLTVISTCSAATTAQMDAASGVRVGSDDTRSVPFGEVAGQDEITGSTGAAATIQPLARFNGKAPLLVCSSEGLSEGHPVRVLEENSPYAINPSAIGADFLVWGEDLKNGDRQCGGSSGSWRGWVDNGSASELPGWWSIDTGNKNGQLVDRLLAGDDACSVSSNADPEDIDGCVVAVPLCPYSNNGPGNNLELYCVRFGAFELTYYEGNAAKGNAPCQRGADNANKILCGEFLGAAVATGGQGSQDPAGPDDVVLIKLVE